MIEREPAVLMWSGGKDAMLALETLREDEAVRAEVLLTTVLEEAETVTMHGVPLSLIEAQAKELGLSLQVMRVPPAASNSTYQEQLERALGPLIARGIRTVAAGDLLLRDVRDYRAAVLRRVGVRPLFPIWQRDTRVLARQFIDRGYHAVLTSVDATQLDPALVGRPFDAQLLHDLPDRVDPCGEKGEFHTFVYDGPLFSQGVPIEVGEPFGEGRMRYIRLRAGPSKGKVRT